jgi:hypothetical protein
MVDHDKHGPGTWNAIEVHLRDSYIDVQILKQPADNRAIRTRLPQFLIDQREVPTAQNRFDSPSNRSWHQKRAESRNPGIEGRAVHPSIDPTLVNSYSEVCYRKCFRPTVIPPADVPPYGHMLVRALESMSERSRQACGLQEFSWFEVFDGLAEAAALKTPFREQVFAFTLALLGSSGLLLTTPALLVLASINSGASPGSSN